MATAREMIRVARDSGADLVKLQAFKAEDISGSMPKAFYKKCAFSFDQYVDLIQYGEFLGIDVFYSIFSPSLVRIRNFQKYIKWAGGQTKKNYKLIEKDDNSKCFVSLREGVQPPHLKFANILHVSDYLTNDPNLERIETLRDYYGRPVGYSDHTMGIGNCFGAIEEFGANVIEKHFTLTRDIYFQGQQFRDAIHAAMPREFEDLVISVRGSH